MKITRIWAMPDKHTFNIKPIRELIIRYRAQHKGKWIDPYANESRLADITNDLNEAYDTDYHKDALEFMKQFEDASIDGVLFDPPYSLTQLKLCYDGIGRAITAGESNGFWTDNKKEISRITKDGAIVISFGWNSGGIGSKYGFETEEILLVPHGGVRNDTIVTVERKRKTYTQTTLI